MRVPTIVRVEAVDPNRTRYSAGLAIMQVEGSAMPPWPGLHVTTPSDAASYNRVNAHEAAADTPFKNVICSATCVPLLGQVSFIWSPRSRKMLFHLNLYGLLKFGSACN